MNISFYISILSLGLSYLLRCYFKKSFYFIKVEGNSMFPTYKHGDWVIVKKTKSCVTNDIIVFKRKHKEENIFLIKRIIGIEDEEIEFKKGAVYKNSRLIFEPYINNQRTYGDKKFQKVKKNHVFVMGDNRNNSLDSRHNRVGQVEKEQILGRVLFVIHKFRI